jgi:signal peptidase I
VKQEETSRSAARAKEDGSRAKKDDGPRAKEESLRGNSLVELVAILAVALGLALGIQAFLVKPYRIPSLSMYPTLEEGQRVLVNRFGNNFGDPNIGDVTVFHPPRGAEDGDVCGLTGREWMPDTEKRACPKPTEGKADVNFIKRIVAGPGDRIKVQDGHVILNGKRQRESFAEPCGGGGACNLPNEITIPKDHYFMMGDNRGQSQDSRYWGPVRREWIIGNAFATYWPPKRIGLL